MSSSPSLNPNQWRFTWESLAHIPTLRLYLFNPNINPSIRCRNLKASFRSSESLLLVTWIDEDPSGEVLLWVPVPRVLIDPDFPVDVRARDDHIEIKLVLVLPVDHPVVVDLCGVLGSDGDGDRFVPLSLDSDLKNLSSGGVHFYCKNCSARLTRQPLRRFVEMPSVNWREVADNWFGACCCSFGGISEKLVSQYIRTYDCAGGTCLLDGASVIICKDDLEGFTFQQCLDGHSDCSYKVNLAPNDNLIDAVKESRRNVSEDIPDVCATCTCDAHKVGRKISYLATESSECEKHTTPLTFPLLSSADCFGNVMQRSDLFLTENSNLAQLSLNEAQSALDVDSLKLNHCSVDLEKPFSESAVEFSSKDQCHCNADESKYILDYLTPAKVLQSSKSSGPERIQKWLHDCSLGSGFMTRTSNLSNDVDWVEFSCRHCSSPLGSYPSSKTTDVPVDGGIRLFKCYISTCVPIGGLHDIFRKHTLQRVFATLLLEGAKDELSYRMVIRDVRTKSPMLQMVLLNSEAWFSTGYCLENATMKPLSETDLQPIVKVLFSDCSTATETTSRITKDWSTRTHAEEVYMMTRQIEELTKYLKSAINRLPHSCSSLQGMSLSSMER